MLQKIMLDDKLLKSFMEGFYGFGNYSAPYWFIGMEEGGDVKEMYKRLAMGNPVGDQGLVDLIEYNQELGVTQWHCEKAKLQSTWRNLIRILLVAEGKPSDNETIRQYQRFSWGIKNGDSCLMELLPLPSPDANSWAYAQYSKLSYLQSREQYEAQMGKLRCDALKTKIADHQPKVIVFYGIKHDKHWKYITGIEAWGESSEGVKFWENGSTLFIVARHPTRGKNAYFHNIGKFILERSN